MRYVFIVLAALAFSLNAHAQGCTRDYSGTVPTETGRGLPAENICFNCRELNQFPQDFSNSAWNYIQFGGAAFTFGNYHESLLNVIGPPSSTMAVRNCSPFGQCATTMVTVNFNTIGIDIRGLPLHIVTSVHNYELVTALPHGATYEVTYFPQLVNQGTLPIPADERGGETYETGVSECLGNDGTIVDDDSTESTNSESDSQDGWDEAQADWEDYWEGWANGYGERTPYSCRPDYSDPNNTITICSGG